MSAVVLSPGAYARRRAMEEPLACLEAERAELAWAWPDWGRMAARELRRAIDEAPLTMAERRALERLEEYGSIRGAARSLRMDRGAVSRIVGRAQLVIRGSLSRYDGWWLCYLEETLRRVLFGEEKES